MGEVMFWFCMLGCIYSGLVLVFLYISLCFVFFCFYFVGVVTLWLPIRTFSDLGGGEATLLLFFKKLKIFLLLVVLGSFVLFFIDFDPPQLGY